MRKPIKKKTKIIICVAVLLVEAGFFIESLYEAENFFFKYNQVGDTWVCDELGLTITYRSGTVSGGLIFKQIEDELVTAKFNDLDKEFELDFGPGHAKQFNLYDRDNEVYALYGKYKMENSDTLIASFEETYTDEINEYWNKNYPEYASKIKSIVVSDKKYEFHKVSK